MTDDTIAYSDDDVAALRAMLDHSTKLSDVVAYVRRRAEDYRLTSPQTCSNMYSLARELEGDEGVRPRFGQDDDDD